MSITVGKLRSELDKLDPNLEVYQCADGVFWDILSILKITKNKTKGFSFGDCNRYPPTIVVLLDED